MASVEYKYKVAITCDGCVRALRNSLTKTYGDRVLKIDADVATQLVSVTLANDPPLTYDEVFQAVGKCGKEVTKLETQ